MDSIVIQIWLDIQQNWTLQVRSLIILVLHIPSTMIQHISIQLSQISAWDRMIFANNVEVLDTRLIYVSSAALNYSHQVLEEKWISSTPFTIEKQMNRQDSGTSNLQQLTSNQGPLLPKPTLWFQLSRGDLIIIPLITVTLKFPIQSFQLILTLNQTQIHTPLQLNQLMMMKLIISWNSYIQNMMKIFYMLTSICFNIDWWSPLIQNFIYSLLCCFINM